MTKKEILINEVDKLPDFMVNQLLDIVHYIKIGIEFEFVPQADNEFYRSQEFKNIVTESISSYQHGNTEDMDLSGGCVRLVLDRDTQLVR